MDYQKLSIQNILTLRYDLTNNSNLDQITSKNFSPKFSVDKFKIKNFLKNTILNNLASTPDVAIALSGGVDSTLLLSLSKEFLPDHKIIALTVTFPQSEDESKSASNIASYFDIEHKTIHIENFLKDLPSAISILKAPYYDVMNWYYLVKNASSLSKFLLTGDGADEIFGGYTFRYSKFLNSLSLSSSPLEKTKKYLECHERDWVPDQEEIFAENLPFSWDQIYENILPFFDNSLDPLDQLFLADYNGKLSHNFVPNYQKFYDFFKISSITPFVDSSLIEYAFHLDHNDKYDPSKNIGKLPLRELVPSNVSELLYPKSKQGFAVNTVALWELYGKEICQQYLFDSKIVKAKHISQDWISKHLTKIDYDKDVRYINKLFSLLAYEIWYRLFITKDMNGNETL